MLGKTDLRVLFCLRRCWEATCKQDFLAERNQLRSYWCLALRTGTCRCCPLSEGAHEPLQNAPWPNTDLEATFTSDRNLQDATADISPCPKEFGCIPSYYLGRLNCKQFSHFCILWIWEEISELRIAFQAASVFFFDSGVKMVLLLLSYFKHCKVCFLPRQHNCCTSICDTD